MTGYPDSANLLVDFQTYDHSLSPKIMSVVLLDATHTISTKTIGVMDIDSSGKKINPVQFTNFAFTSSQPLKLNVLLDDTSTRTFDLDPLLVYRCNNNDKLSYTKTDLQNHPAASASLVAKAKFYGTYKNSWIVLDFDSYNHSVNNKIVSLNLVRDNGFILASKTLSNANIRSNDTLRYIVFRNLRLNASEALHVVITLTDNTTAKFTFSQAQVGFEEAVLINNWAYPIVHATNSYFPDSFGDHQAIASFALTVPKVGFSEPPTAALKATYTFAGNRPLMTAQSNATFSRPTIMNGYLITDLMGKELNVATGGTIDLIEYPTLIFHKLVNGKSYRTIVSLT